MNMENISWGGNDSLGKELTKFVDYKALFFIFNLIQLF